MKDNLNKLIWLRDILNKNKVSIIFFSYLICAINGTIYGFQVEGLGFQDFISIITEAWLRMSITGAIMVTIIYFLFNKIKQKRIIGIKNIKVFLMSMGMMIFFPGWFIFIYIYTFVVWTMIIVWIVILIFIKYVSVLERKYQR